MNNQFIGSQTGLIVRIADPIVTMNADSFTGISGHFIQEMEVPNDIWPYPFS